MQNRSTEDYLKQIYCIGARIDKVTTSAIAEKLNISSASVTDMIKKLGDQGYVEYTPYHGVQLTARGERLALRVIRRHRLVELFLVKALGYTWDNVHEEAERLEHVISEEFEQRIDEFLGHPKYDPHGDPIPSFKGELEDLAYARLSELEKGDHAIIKRVTDSKNLLQLMKKMELDLEHRIAVTEKEAFDDSMTVRINGRKDQFLSREVTDNIYVKRVGKEHERKKAK
jgi:DtxR family Mn-dependent transcriptional regulator